MGSEWAPGLVSGRFAAAGPFMIPIFFTFYEKIFRGNSHLPGIYADHAGPSEFSRGEPPPGSVSPSRQLQVPFDSASLRSEPVTF
jgi:hypothetical protein